MTRNAEILFKATGGMFDEHEGGITGILNAMDEYSKEVAIGFLKWYGVKMMEFVLYFQRKKENPIIYYIPDAYDKYIEEFEGKTQEQLFDQYLNHLNTIKDEQPIK